MVVGSNKCGAARTSTHATAASFDNVRAECELCHGSATNQPLTIVPLLVARATRVRPPRSALTRRARAAQQPVHVLCSCAALPTDHTFMAHPTKCACVPPPYRPRAMARCEKTCLRQN